VFAIALLVSYLAVHVSPAIFAIPAFFGLAFPYLLLINFLFAITWGILLRIEILISVIVIAAGYNHLINYIKIGRHKGDTEGTFMVMSYNIRLFNSFEKNKSNVNSEKRIIELINNQQPDIVCLQEFFVLGSSPAEKDKTFKAALRGKYHSHLKTIKSGNDRYYGIVTYSKFPIINKGEIIHPGSSSLSIYTDIIIKKDTFRIFNNHLQSFRLKNMEHSIFEMTSANEKETLGEIRSISSSLKKGFISRSIQAQLLKQNIDNSPFPVLVIGDFNDTPVSYSYRRIRQGLGDSFVSSGYGAGFTYKGNYPPNRIDYILYGNKLESIYFDILKVKYSDHYPIFAWFRKSD
jgi:endonuclease/exonuclease/phosphatase family metal-dependent hydrolase